MRSPTGSRRRWARTRRWSRVTSKPAARPRVHRPKAVTTATASTPIAAFYLQAILAGNRTAALNVALDALRSGMGVIDIYTELLQPAQYELGNLWETNGSPSRVSTWPRP